MGNTSREARRVRLMKISTLLAAHERAERRGRLVAAEVLVYLLDRELRTLEPRRHCTPPPSSSELAELPSLPPIPAAPALGRFERLTARPGAR